MSVKEKIAVRVARNGIIVNTLLSGCKLFAGINARSAAMISDAVHSLSDVFAEFIVIAGVKLAGKEADREHPYGHERLECVAAILLAGILCAVGVVIGYGGAVKVISGDRSALVVPGALALIAAVVSIVVKEAMYWYTRSAAKRVSSSALMASAWHHRSDALSSVGSFVGILGARMGLPILDPVASIIICGFIIKAAVGIFRDAIGKMTDKSCSEAFVESVQEAILQIPSVLLVDQLQTRLFGDRVYVDVEISADNRLTFAESHHAATQVEEAVKTRFPLVKRCMVHVNPCNEQAAVPSEG